MNKRLIKLLKKNKKTVIGLLSGTSVDSIDAVLVQIAGSGLETRIKVTDFTELPIPKDVRQAIFRNSDKKTARVDEISGLNTIIGALFSDAVLKILRRNKLNPASVDLIGSHGQTIHHLPAKTDYVGYKMKSTLQIGDPSIIANLTGITTVGDFRIADCAVDGDGAPLVPYLDHIMFTHKSKNRALLNIGGIANITVLKKNARKQDVFAFDTGPGNMLIDGTMYHLFKMKYDKNSFAGKRGILAPELFNFLLTDPVYRAEPPKSTGREHYGMEFQKRLLGKFWKVNKFDFIRTVTEFTAFSIWYNYNNFVEPEVKADELIVSGGGALNPLLMKLLKNYFKGVKVSKLVMNGITAKNKEAVLFAVLANECIAGNPANMNRVTGSTKDVILGKICQ